MPTRRTFLQQKRHRKQEFIFFLISFLQKPNQKNTNKIFEL